jgi:putative cell wall-binding protein
MDLFVLGPAEPIEHNVAARSLNDPAGSPIVLAAGAFHWNTGAVESFSSRGPNINGLVKPDLAAPDGVSSGSLGLFFGTSAAAPHTSGAAALLQEAEGLCSPVALHLLMLGQTEAVGDPVPNNDYGHGRLLLDSPPTPPDPVIRYAGANRYATAAQTSQADFPCGARTVFVATGENFPDALAAAAVAGGLNAPILLVQANSVPKATSDELARLDPDQIVILGGTAVVSAAVATALAGHAPVTRLAGSNRYATAVEVSKFAFPVPAAVTDVFVATGTGFADALAGGPAGAYLGGPVLLVEPNALPAVTATEIQRLGPQRVWVLGGPAAVSNAVVAQIEGLGFTTIRVSGANRYATAVEVSKLVFLGPTAETDGSIVHRVYIAVGTNFPDAVAGGGVAGLRFAPVLLVEANSIAQVVTDEVTRLNPRQIVILGGTAAVSTAVEVALEALI